mgnify:CR=1 FL=1
MVLGLGVISWPVSSHETKISLLEEQIQSNWPFFACQENYDSTSYIYTIYNNLFFWTKDKSKINNQASIIRFGVKYVIALTCLKSESNSLKILQNTKILNFKIMII